MLRCKAIGNELYEFHQIQIRFHFFFLCSSENVQFGVPKKPFALFCNALVSQIIAAIFHLHLKTSNGSHTHTQPTKRKTNQQRPTTRHRWYIWIFSRKNIYHMPMFNSIFNAWLGLFFFARHICSLAQLERFFSPQISVTSCIASKWPPNSSWLGYSIYSAQTNPFLTWIKNIRPISFPIERKDFLHEAS